MCKLKKLSINDFQSQNGNLPLGENTYYQRDNAVLDYLFSNMPNNDKAEEVFIKVVVIDFIYSTQLKRLIGEEGVHHLVDLILSVDFDARVKQGDPTLVSEIANNNGGVNLFSFASKYCALHNWYVYDKDDYSIYDSVVARLFPEYTDMEHKNNPDVSKISKAQVERWRQGKNYKEFNDAIGDFLDKCGFDKSKCSKRRRVFDGIIWEQR